MKILYVCDTRFSIFNSKEKKYLFKYWSYSLQDIINNSKSRNINFWLVCINLIDYLDILNFSDLFDYENVKKAIEKISYYFQFNNNDEMNNKEITVDPLLAFFKSAENIVKIKECNKIIILSCNIYMWENKISELKLIGDTFYTYLCEFYFFNIENNKISAINKIDQIKNDLDKYSNFFFKNIKLNKINILQISKEILSIKFLVSFTLNLKNELLFKCEGIPLITELSHSSYIGLNKFSIEFDIRAKALKDGISQHLIYGIPIFLSSISFYKTNLISLCSLSKELYEKDQVLILRSNINPIDLKIHEKEVRFLWVGVPMIKDEKSIALCLHGLSTQETYSLSIEESLLKIETPKNISETKLKEIFNFLILVDEFNPLDYSNQRFEYSFKNSRSSLIDTLNKQKSFKKRKKKLTILQKNMDDDLEIQKEILQKNDIPKSKDIGKKKEIIDPRSLLLDNMNKAFQKNII
ncbi:conserved Plasmodium protein, unknown function [Plasmodium gallinaceum]|uniref:Uncharacterized protein n=1 Tax=Plasmodium gallinaceum TaxID=5849 RepID=A0A1J1GW01_PLAGA|nr:conserved Plasmodium protein, unknown function [Plasmodium gallinaceum]CRG95196.1 conserved Plasmodium protein, unknown function [Plasmodium gallinaceum]